MLTSKQRASLRSQANTIDTIFQIGKGDIKETLIKQLNDALEARELIKIRVLETSMMSAKEAAQEIGRLTEAEVVAVIGSRIILYKESRKNKKIII